MHGNCDIVTTANDYQPVTIVTRNFVLDATDVLGLCMLDVKSVRASVPIRLCILCVLAVQSSLITLEQCSAES